MEQRRPMTESSAQKLFKAYYGHLLEGDVQLKGIGTSHEISSRNFAVSAGDGRPRFLLKYVSDACADRFLRGLALQQRLTTRRVSAPDVIETRLGRSHVSMAEGLLALYSYCDGHSFSGRRAELSDLGNQLAGLVRSLSDVAPPKEADPSYDYSYLSPAEISLARRGLEGHARSGARVLMRRWLPRVVAMYHQMDSALEDLPRRSMWTHFDLHLDNALFKNGRVQALLDFETVAWTCPYRSLAFACGRFLEKEGSVEDFWAIVQGYNEVMPLSPRIVKAIPYLMLEEELRRMSLLYRDVVIRGRERWSFAFAERIRCLEGERQWLPIADLPDAFVEERLSHPLRLLLQDAPHT